MSNRRVQLEQNFRLAETTDTYQRQYFAYTTWWLNGEYDGSTMFRVMLP